VNLEALLEAERRTTSLQRTSSLHSNFNKTFHWPWACPTLWYGS